MSFYKVNEVDLFKCDRPFHRGQRDDNNEFKVCDCSFKCGFFIFVHGIFVIC